MYGDCSDTATAADVAQMLIWCRRSTVWWRLFAFIGLLSTASDPLTSTDSPYLTQEKCSWKNIRNITKRGLLPYDGQRQSVLTLTVGLGAQSTLAGKTLLPENICMKINKMPEFYTMFAGKIFSAAPRLPRVRLCHLLFVYGRYIIWRWTNLSADIAAGLHFAACEMRWNK